ncbi:MAG: SH3 domain-containing protein [Chlorobi bacterium]|nr:SH3 domain-containing protein [Chlorobiota bacterium]MCI0715537.1 SH3 domain-containing protein [Chlorobiota bacterium]
MHTSDKLNVRVGPGSQYAVIKTLSKEDKIKIKEIKNGWYKISDLDEWISGKFIKFIV